MDLPEIPLNRDLTYLGITTYRDKNQLFGIKRKDRRQHVYILGKSGTGKSVLMFNMMIQNIQNGEGVCVVDPHGELVEGVLSAIPPHRMKDVIYFNPADAEHHIGFNVLELVDPQYKHLVASGLMGIFTKIWANAWSARMEYILNNCILALLDTPGTTLLGIPRMLVDKDYRQKIITNLKDPVIKAFWVHEYEAWQDKFRNEAIAPIQNKVGQFLSTSIIRNVVGQSKSTINVFDIMNEGKIFLVNVSKGRIGEDNSALLGGMIITKIQLAAMERVRIPEESRRDFYLYVDEFQNFVTDAFAGILSEARKYRLNLTVAHQYTAQLVSDKSSAVRDAVFGNVGTMIVFRVGSDDADFLEKEFDPEFTPGDIVNLPNYKIYLKLMIDGITSRPFSAKTLPPMVKSGNKEVVDEVIRTSRELYCRPRDVIEKEIIDWSGMSLGDDGAVGVTAGGLEKFPIICSLCGLEKSVPFKPEPGRPAYCKECIAKIKSGEVKVEKGSADSQMKYDDSKYFKPLADLGIEFPDKSASNGKAEKKVENKDATLASKPAGGILSSIKKAFHRDDKPKPASAPNIALKEVLNKTLSEEKPVVPKVPARNASSIADAGGEAPKPTTPPLAPAPSTSSGQATPAPVSLDTLKNKLKESTEVVKKEFVNTKDRSASEENVNKLKDLINASATTKSPLQPKVEPVKVEPPRVEVPKVEPVKVEIPTPAPTPPPKIEIPKAPTPAPTPVVAPKVEGTEPPLTTGNIKEVPEDVLMKILGE